MHFEVNRRRTRRPFTMGAVVAVALCASLAVHAGVSEAKPKNSLKMDYIMCEKGRYLGIVKTSIAPSAVKVISVPRLLGSDDRARVCANVYANPGPASVRGR